MEPQVDIHLIVHNGEKYIRRCLEAITKQTYPNVKLRIFDNASTDNTAEIAKSLLPEVEVVKFKKNYVLGGGFNRSLYYSESPYVVGLSVDVAIAPDFTEKAVRAMEENKEVGVLQAKILRYDFENNENTDVIDTTGMTVFKSRRVINRGHGEIDQGQYDTPEEIFCYEGAVPFFRREALEDARMKKFPPYEAFYVDKYDIQKYPYEYLDEDFVWYADEVDLGWRMRLLGWRSWYEPTVLAWHDRQTTHKLSGGYRAFIRERKNVPAFKRKLDLQNQRLTFIKNGFWSNMILHIPWFFKRELFLFIYVLIWERSSIPAYWNIIRMTPKILKKRKEIMKKRKTNAKEMRKWFE
ncbi:MAG: glycosyltransferase family 2 protein [Candidatus Spechtbacterales bacterium]|nr:glycosyltransferase family 2 protein [Candidatus Spechtbacterales bacterium]